MVARRQHFVSQCYLKAFAVPRKKDQYQTNVYDRISGRYFNTSIANVAHERDFNRVEVEGAEVDVIEKALAEFEAKLAAALERIINTSSLKNEDDRAVLLNFICLLALRNPAIRENIRAFTADILKKTMELVLATKERWEEHIKRMRKERPIEGEEAISYEDIKAYFDKGDFTIALKNEWHIQLELDMFEKTLATFFGRGWMLLKAPSDTNGFVTSDHPTCLMWADPRQRSSFYGPGLGVPGTHLFFPISPKLAVVGAFELKDSEHTIGELGVARFNGGTIAYAQRQVYARNTHFMYVMQPNQAPKKANKDGDRSGEGFRQPARLPA